MEILADKISGLSPCYAVDEICLPLAILILELTVYGNGEVAVSRLIGCQLDLGILCNSSYQFYSVHCLLLEHQ